MKKWISRFLPVLALALTLCIPQVYADSQAGSISIEIRAYATDRAVSGGTLHLYRVAEADGMELIYTEKFSGCDESLLTQEELEKAETAELLEAFADKNGLAADDTETVSSSGRASFGNLDEGLYMVSRKEPAEGYTSVNAFLVTIPLEEDGTFVYDVDASPKALPVEKTANSSSRENAAIEKTSSSDAITWAAADDVTAPTDSVTASGTPRTGDEPVGFIASAMCAALAAGAFIYDRRKRTSSSGGDRA